MNTHIDTPKVRFLGNQRQIAPGAQLARIGFALYCVVIPIGALISTLLVAANAWIFHNKIRGIYVTVFGLVLTSAATIRGYATVLIDTYIRFTHHILATLSPYALDASSEIHWGSLFFDVLPFSAATGIFISGIVISIRGRYTRTTNADNQTPTTHATVKAIEKAKAKQNDAIKKAAPAESLDNVTIPLGIDAFTAESVSIDVPQLRAHGVITGPTGLGKTQVIQRIISCLMAAPQAVSFKIPLILFDMKGDPDLARFIEQIAIATDRTAHIITCKPVTSTTTYNSFARQEPDEIADSIYETIYAHDPTLNTHYANLSRRLLQIASHVLVDVSSKYPNKYPKSLHTLFHFLDVAALEKVQKDLTHNTSINLAQYLDDVTNNNQIRDLGDIRDRLATIINTTAGRVLSHDGCTLENAIENGDIVLFSLDAASTPETARTIGTLAIQDLIATFSRLQTKNWGKNHICPVILDEFSALKTDKVADLYARARSAGGAVLLATQDLDADLNAISPEFASAVRTNSNMWIVLRQTRAEMAEIVSNDIGTYTTWKNTLQVQEDWDLLGGTNTASGTGSLREVEEYYLHPNQIKSLPQGSAYLVMKIPIGTINTHAVKPIIKRIHINAPGLPTHTDNPPTPQQAHPKAATEIPPTQKAPQTPQLQTPPTPPQLQTPPTPPQLQTLLRPQTRIRISNVAVTQPATDNIRTFEDEPIILEPVFGTKPKTSNDKPAVVIDSDTPQPQYAPDWYEEE